jgi:SAM-dependent methyltransferase
MKDIIQTSFNKLRQDPVGFLRRAIFKTLIAPVKYHSKDGYDAARYWSDRLKKYGTAMKGVGDEGLSEQANYEIYETASTAFLGLCRQESIDLSSARVLEIGCGNGFYTRILKQQGVTRYLGVDITDALFPVLTNRFSGFQFICRDITTDVIDGEFDLIVMIDVIEHIVLEEKLDFAMSNIQRCLAKNGRFFVAPVLKHGRRSMFHVRFWTVGDIMSRLSQCSVSDPVLFRGSNLLIVKKPIRPTDAIGTN